MRVKRDQQFAIRLAASEKRQLVRLAEREDVTLTHLIRQAIKQVLATSGGERPR